MNLRICALLFFLVGFATAGPGYSLLDGQVSSSEVPGVGGGGGGGGTVDSVVAGDKVTVDSSDPANPIISTVGVTLPSGALVSFTEENIFENRTQIDPTAFYLFNWDAGTYTAQLLLPTFQFSGPQPYTLPDKSGTLAMLEDLGLASSWDDGGGGFGSTAFAANSSGYINPGADYTAVWGRNSYVSSSGADHNVLISGGTTASSYINVGAYGNVALLNGVLIRYAANAYNFIAGVGSSMQEGIGTANNYNVQGAQVSYMKNGSEYTTVLGGYQGQVLAGDYGVTGGGQANQHNGSAYGVMLTGNSNFVGVNQSYGTVAGGNQCDTVSGANYSTVCSGLGNIVSGGDYSTILSGWASKAPGDYCLAHGRKSLANDVGSAVFSDQSNVDTLSGGADSITFDYTGGIDITPVTTAPVAPADDRITLFMYNDGAGGYSFRTKFTDNTVNTVTSHTP